MSSENTSESEFPLKTESYNTQNVVSVTVYTRGHSIENIVTHPEPEGLAVELDVDGKHCVKAWAFCGRVKPESLKIDQGKIKFEITLQKELPMQWPKTVKDEAEAKPLYQRWQTVKVPEEEEEKPEGIDNFLRKIYKDADDDTRRAMMKSYQESNGTVLSCNWADVGSHHVDPQPPGQNDNK